MAYRNGTYVAFHAGGTSNQAESDIKYYRILQAWHEHKNINFDLINSHEKTAQVRDTSQRLTLASRIQERLRNSKNFLLINTPNTRLDNDWVNFEVSQAIDAYELPIIVAYPDYTSITNPMLLWNVWPDALRKRIEIGTAKVIHIAFKLDPIKSALNQFDINNRPQWSDTHYTAEAYRQWGLI